jgi:hypothetical protein
MASLLKALLEFLRSLRFPTHFIKRCSGYWQWLWTFIFRRLGLWRCRPKNPDTVRKPRPAEPSESFPCVGTGGYVVAASTVPTSASLPDLRERAPRQLTTATPSAAKFPPVQTIGNLSADRAPSAYDVTLPANCSSANISIQSRASDRLSILTQSRESLRGPVGQPSRSSRGAYRQFGLGPKSMSSRERLSRPPTPSIHFSPPQHPPLPPPLQVDTANLVVEINPPTSPTAVASPFSFTHDPLSPPADRRNHRRHSSGCVTVDVQTPSTESLPLKPPSPPRFPTVHSPTFSVVEKIPKESLQVSPSAPPVVSGFSQPDSRIVVPIHSYDVPRYSKDIKMQVICSELRFYPYKSET